MLQNSQSKQHLTFWFQTAIYWSVTETKAPQFNSRYWPIGYFKFPHWELLSLRTNLKWCKKKHHHHLIIFHTLRITLLEIPCHSCILHTGIWPHYSCWPQDWTLFLKNKTKHTNTWKTGPLKCNTYKTPSKNIQWNQIITPIFRSQVQNEIKDDSDRTFSPPSDQSAAYVKQI